MSINPLTELEAVNIILDNDGEAPVASLEEDGFAEATRALAVLREASRTVQEKGWSFNTDFDRSFNPNIQNEISLPDNVLWLRPSISNAAVKVAQRGSRLYDMRTNGYTFNRPVRLDVCQGVPFDELPSTARSYVAVMAARIYQARSTGSPQQFSFTQEDEYRAKVSLHRAERKTNPKNMFDNPEMARANNRRL